VSAADDEVTHEFLVESHENLDRLEHELLAFEQAGQSVDSIFRVIHTIKGTAGFLGFARLQQLTHVAETLLDAVRDGALVLGSPGVSALLDVVDACRLMLAAVKAHGHDDAGDHSALIATLEALHGGAAAVVATPTAPHVEQTPAPETTVRVDVELLDKLMDLAGELVLARNQLLQLTAERSDVAQRIDHITSELQDHVMRTRMQPIGGIWSKLPRVVRDLAGELGKQVRLELDGSETGLDRSIIEAIKDPLTHIVRNAIDHGIERPDVRALAGKPVEGTLRLRASHEGGHVMLEITDDGAGIDPARVRAKALERGVVGVERAAQMTDAEVVELVFEPGFSTADTITNISGRGVGMDVVKHNIERIGGVVAIDSRRGAGTTMRIKLPLTLAIVPALIVDANGERYAVAQVGVRELVRIDRTVESIHGAPMYRLRGNLLPLVYLDEVLGGVTRTGTTIVVLQNEGRAFGLVVDAVHDTEEIVVKPVGQRLRDVPTYAGATILGDGRIALILDVRGIAARAGVGDVKHDKPRPAVARAPRDRCLVVEAGAGRRVAVALDRVIRIEPFDARAVELAAGIEVVQRGARVLPLLRLGSDARHVVVYAGARELGLVVGDIVDIFERADVASWNGAEVIDGRVTDVADVDALAARMGLAA
jgi:two-component system chemotaxis sensor kinase CheA